MVPSRSRSRSPSFSLRAVRDLHSCPSLGVHARDAKVLKDSAVEELHDVKGRTDHGVVLAEAVGLGNGHAGARGAGRVGLANGAHDAVLALDLVRGLGQELAGGLLAEHIAVAGGRGELVGGVGLTKAELQGEEIFGERRAPEVGRTRGAGNERGVSRSERQGRGIKEEQGVGVSTQTKKKKNKDNEEIENIAV